MGNVNMEADQIRVRNNSHKSWATVAEALKALETADEIVVEDITELYTRDASRASKEDIANEYSDDTNYYIGDLVYYEGRLWKCVVNHPAGSSFSTDDFIVTNVSNNLVTDPGLSYYVETHVAQQDNTFSHTFQRQPKVIMQIVQPQTAVGAPVSIITPIAFDTDGSLINSIMRIIRQNNQITEETLSWDSETKTLTYTAVDWDLAFNRANSKIVYLA